MPSVLDIFFPKSCLGCKKGGKFFCRKCINQIKQHDLICPVCLEVSNGGETHLECTGKYTLDGLWSLASFEGVVRQAIYSLKYRFVTDAANELVEILTRYCSNYNPLFLDHVKTDKNKWVVAGVPIVKSKANWRGFNQSEVIGKGIARFLNLPYIDALEQVKSTDHKSKIYRVTQKVKDKNILLVDDIWVTGTTMRECAKTLKKSGVKYIWGMSLTR